MDIPERSEQSIAESAAPEATEARAASEAPEAPGTPEAPETPHPAPRVRRRGRTALLLTAAAVLGVVAGTCTGYLIQADREPTPLPPLPQTVVEQAKGRVEPLPAAQDPRVRTDGDLRKLLIPRPSGARDLSYPLGDDGWMTLADFANEYEEPRQAFAEQLVMEFRRAAVTSWRTTDTHQVEIYLVQYRQEEKVAAAEQADNGMYFAEHESGSRSWPIPGTGDGRAYVIDSPYREPGYLPLYSARAHAWRGDIAMDIYIYDTKPISKKEIMSLAQRQVGRL
ncbi:hypothetical protein [Streptomyces thermoalcalitolerans]|uniref:Uncharacterized protein n=1 Tax=Streptomyces thermoalcalitolerans TaxID=65605 RepID=A0ABN1P2U8_9ACTN